MVLGGVIAECSDCIVHSLQSDVMSLCRRAPGFGGGPRIQGGGFSRVTGWWWVVLGVGSAGGREIRRRAQRGLQGAGQRIQGGGAGCGGEHARGCDELTTIRGLLLGG